MNSVNVNYLKCSVHYTCQHCQITACAHVYGGEYFVTSYFGLMTDSALVDAALRKSGLI